MIVELQCIPNPPGTPDRRYAHIEAAIAVIEASGLRYEVSALGTAVEGSPDEVWPVVRAAHEATMAAGAASVISVIKVADWSDRADPASIEHLTREYRDRP